MNNYNFLRPAGFALIMCLGLMTSHSTNAQVDMNQAHSLFLYNFAKYSEFPNKNNAFKITILGNNKLHKTLSKVVRDRKIQGLSMVVKNVPSLKALLSELSDTNILFIPSSNSELISEVVKATQGKPILIITEQSGLHQQGACVSFLMLNSKLKFQVNTSTLSTRNVKIARGMLNLAHKG